MRFRCALLLAVLPLLALAAPAGANYRVGLSEQSGALFADHNWQSLHLKRVRYVLAWDWYKNRGQVDEADYFLKGARATGQEVLLTFSAHRGCWVNSRYSKAKACRAPSQKAYADAIKRFRKAYPWVKVFSAWNEENHPSQPTSGSPKLAAQYYATMVKTCKKCTIVAADVLDYRNYTGWLRSFLRFSHGKGRIWGLHNYSEVNNHKATHLQAVLRTVPGEVWLTETGGIVTFLPKFKTSQSRAATATKYLFQVADKYDARLRGQKSKLTRVYVYRWFGEAPGARFDSGLVNPDGSARPAFAAFKAGAARHQK